MATGAGIFYDGITAARHAVTVETGASALRIAGADGATLAEWPYAELEHHAAADDVLRLGRVGGRVLARLDVRDPALASAIDELSEPVDRTGGVQGRARRRVIGWAMAATVSIVGVALFGIPALVDRLAPLVPLSVERRIGVAVNDQAREMLDTGESDGPFVCTGDLRAQAVLKGLVARLEQAAGLPIPLNLTVVRRKESNAIALPGGHIYVFQGLIDQATRPDELAGVIAHEIGHIAHRDGTRSMLQSAGLSFLFGMLLGDFTGGGLVVLAARTVVQKAYSREVETAADLYGVQLMTRIGGDPRALGTMLERIAGKGDEPGMPNILEDHPLTEARVKAIDAASPPGVRAPVLNADDWAALRRICR